MLIGSGFSLLSIDSILINVNKYTPIGCSSYIPLLACIERKKVTINVQNTDEKCFKYSILAKLVNPIHAE
jgi:glutaminase